MSTLWLCKDASAFNYLYNGCVGSIGEVIDDDVPAGGVVPRVNYTLRRGDFTFRTTMVRKSTLYNNFKKLERYNNG